MDTLADLVAAAERDASLDAPESLRERVEALDVLEAHLEGIHADGGAETALHERARALARRLNAANERLFDSLRDGIRHGAGTRLLEFAQGVSAAGEGYDHLDVLVAGVLRFADPQTDDDGLAPDMVAYQPTPARHIFDLFARLGLTGGDVLVDLGSGLGHVPLLAASCTEATGVGIEVQPGYVDAARRCAADLRLRRATFVAQDAREADLSAASVFYLYTPFRGPMLLEMLDALHHEAADRPIRIATFGPCTAVVAREAWLVPDAPVRPDRAAIFRATR